MNLLLGISTYSKFFDEELINKDLFVKLILFFPSLIGLK